MPLAPPITDSSNPIHKGVIAYNVYYDTVSETYKLVEDRQSSTFSFDEGDLRKASLVDRFPVSIDPSDSAALERILEEIQKTNLYLEEILGDKF